MAEALSPFRRAGALVRAVGRKAAELAREMDSAERPSDLQGSVVGISDLMTRTADALSAFESAARDGGGDEAQQATYLKRRVSMRISSVVAAAGETTRALGGPDFEAARAAMTRAVEGIGAEGERALARAAGADPEAYRRPDPEIRVFGSLPVDGMRAAEVDLAIAAPPDPEVLEELLRAAAREAGGSRLEADTADLVLNGAADRPEVRAIEEIARSTGKPVRAVISGAPALGSVRFDLRAERWVMDPGGAPPADAVAAAVPADREEIEEMAARDMHRRRARRARK